KRNSKHSKIVARYGIQRKIEFQSSIWDVVKQWEIETIAQLQTYTTFWSVQVDIGCNFTRGGEGTLGFIPSRETRMKQSQAIKKAAQNPEYRANISKRQKRLMADPLHKAKISLGIKRAFSMKSKESLALMRQRISIANTGKISPVRGSSSPRTELSESDVANIKKFYLQYMQNTCYKRGKSTHLMCQIAEDYGTTYQSIYKIITGATWTHVKVAYRRQTI